MFKMKQADILSSIILIVFAIWAYIEANSFTEEAATLPHIILSLIVVIALVQLLKAIVKPSDKTFSIEGKRILKLFFMFAAYVLLMKILGFYISTILYLVISMFVFGVKKKAAYVITPVVFLLMVYFVFETYLHFKPPVPFFM